MKSKKITKTKPINSEMNNIVSRFIVWVYIFVIMFLGLTLISPDWFKNATTTGRKGEAKEFKNHGDNFMDLKNYEMAITQYQQAVKIDPEFAGAYTNMGISYHIMGDNQSARNSISKALTFDTELQDAAYYYLAEIYLGNGETEKAINYYLQSAKLSPFPIFAYQKAGELLSNIKQFPKAFQAFNLAFANAFSMENCYRGMLQKSFYIFEIENVKSEVKQLMEQDLSKVDFSAYDEKIFLYQEKFHEINATLYNQYGYIYIQTQNLDSARICFEKALEVKPDFLNAQKNLDLVNRVLPQKSI
jgi:tetratricopeptide (TPR) repeat protein